MSSKDEVISRFHEMAALPQCIRLSAYAEGNLVGGIVRKDDAGALALTNALTGAVVVVVVTPGARHLLKGPDPEKWGLVMATPVLGYPDTYGALAMRAHTTLTPDEAQQLCLAWSAQALQITLLSGGVSHDAHY